MTKYYHINVDCNQSSKTGNNRSNIIVISYLKRYIKKRLKPVGERGVKLAETNDYSDLLEYRQSVLNQPESEFQKITIDIIDKAIENLKKQV